MTEIVVKASNVWKVFGTNAEQAIQAIKDEGIGKPEVLERFGCVVGVQDASFEVPRGEIQIRQKRNRKMLIPAI